MTRLAAVALAGAVLLTGCAGRAPDDAAAGTSSGTSSSSPPASSPQASSPPASAGSGAATEDGSGQRIEVRVSGGEVTGATGRVPVAIGTEVELVVTSDIADELHVHGYDLTVPLAAGQPAPLSFDATLAGVFEVELHDAGTVLLTLQVG